MITEEVQRSLRFFFFFSEKVTLTILLFANYAIHSFSSSLSILSQRVRKREKERKKEKKEKFWLTLINYLKYNVI